MVAAIQNDINIYFNVNSCDLAAKIGNNYCFFTLHGSNLTSEKLQKIINAAIRVYKISDPGNLEFQKLQSELGINCDLIGLFPTFGRRYQVRMNIEIENYLK